MGHVGPFEVGHVGPGGYKSLLLSVTRLIFIEIMKLFFLVISRTVSFAKKMIRDMLLLCSMLYNSLIKYIGPMGPMNLQQMGHVGPPDKTRSDLFS